MLLPEHCYLEMKGLSLQEIPFKYAVSPSALNIESIQSILSWMEGSAPWSLVETDFYEQYEFSFKDITLPDHLSFLARREQLLLIRDFIAGIFRSTLSDRIDFTAHKLLTGQRIRIHNDFIPGMETHRLLIQLNRGWQDENGGMLMFFNSRDPQDLHRVFRPISNSAVAFEISRNSNHAVSAINGGERYTLVYSFYSDDNE